MLYYLFKWLETFNFPGARMFGYTSFRSLVAIILALLISSIFGVYFINLLKRHQITETQRDAKIDPFGVNKIGVPSMGGIIIVFAILLPCLLLGKLHNVYMILMLISLSCKSCFGNTLKYSPMSSLQISFQFLNTL